MSLLLYLHPSLPMQRIFAPEGQLGVGAPVVIYSLSPLRAAFKQNVKAEVRGHQHCPWGAVVPSLLLQGR